MKFNKARNKARILFTGKGGDGVQFAAKLFAKTMVNNGFNATLMPVYGPEARGATSNSVVIIDTDEIITPICKEYDILVAFNEEDKLKNDHIKYQIYSSKFKSNVEHVAYLLDNFGISPKLAISILESMISPKYQSRLDEGINILNNFDRKV